MEGIESTERILFNQISGEMKDFVVYLNNQIGGPFKFKEPANLTVPDPGEMAFAHAASQSCVDFGVSNLRSDDYHLIFKHLTNLLGSRFPDVALD